MNSLKFKAGNEAEQCDYHPLYIVI